MQYICALNVCSTLFECRVCVIQRRQLQSLRTIPSFHFILSERLPHRYFHWPLDSTMQLLFLFLWQLIAVSIYDQKHNRFSLNFLRFVNFLLGLLTTRRCLFRRCSTLKKNVCEDTLRDRPPLVG